LLDRRPSEDRSIPGDGPVALMLMWFNIVSGAMSRLKAS
jgi:hypothetical protein